MQWLTLATVLILLAVNPLPDNSRLLKILVLVLIVAGNILFGKLFCSHLCPAGFIQETVFKLRKRLFPSNPDRLSLNVKRWSRADKLLRSLKYIVLVLIFADCNIFLNITLIPILLIFAISGRMALCTYLCPVNAMSNICRYTVVFALFLLLNVILESLSITIGAWLMAAAASAVCYTLEITLHKSEYNISLLHIHKDQSKCNRCTICTGSCPFEIDFKRVKRVTDIDCNLCGECVKACTQDAIKVGICNTRPGQNRIRGIWFAPLITISLLAIAIYLFYA